MDQKVVIIKFEVTVRQITTLASEMAKKNLYTSYECAFIYWSNKNEYS